ncbi:hypothetical protein L1887_14146 [Cichorium endivia]|nr:hypothetical protein L1887_14146 [Cichorium endivia]
MTPAHCSLSVIPKPISIELQQTISLSQASLLSKSPAKFRISSHLIVRLQDSSRLKSKYEDALLNVEVKQTHGRLGNRQNPSHLPILEVQKLSNRVPCNFEFEKYPDWGLKAMALSLSFGYFDYGYRGTSFEQTYRCYPASFIDKAHIENGDKIIMPPSALDRLASLHIDYPMLFELRNVSSERVSHCGVLEFIAEEGLIYMPYWMMQNLLLQEGDIVRVKNVTLPKGTYVKLQPHTSDFLNISNPKAILETTLRNFSCLTTGDSIMVAYNNKKYYINIIESKPSNAITIIETDCEVDFAPPLDYKQPERPVSSSSKPPTQDEVAVQEEPKFNAFTGSGRRLDGKPLKHQPPPVAKQQAVSGSGGGPPPAASTSRQTQGKLVFGSNAATPQKQKEVGKESKPEQPSKEEPKFQAFTGKKYSLKG